MTDSKLTKKGRVVRRGTGACAGTDVQLGGRLIGGKLGGDAIEIVDAGLGEVGEAGVKGPERAIVIDARSSQNRRKWRRFQTDGPPRHREKAGAEHRAEVTEMRFSVRFRFGRRVHGR